MFHSWQLSLLKSQADWGVKWPWKRAPSWSPKERSFPAPVWVYRAQTKEGEGRSNLHSQQATCEPPLYLGWAVPLEK